MLDLGLEPNSGEDCPPEDSNYPLSYLYIDAKIAVEKGEDPIIVADETLERLETMLRLFQVGDIYLRRHKIWTEQGSPYFFVAWSLPPLGALSKINEGKEEPLHWRGEYKLDDAALGEFIEFFNSYWDIILQKPQPLYIALFRFNTSYERRTLADRLVELMIAMEALFGDKGELTYKIALRSACLLYRVGEARAKAFKTIKKLYDERSDIVHGRSLTSESDNKRINQFEDYVRSSIVKFLELHKKGRPVTSGTQLDEFLFFTKQTD